MSNTFGYFYKTTTFGESHGKFTGAVLDGVPGNVALNLDKIQDNLNRRKPGVSKLTSPRKESDRIQVISGLQNNLTLGSPLTFLVANEDARPEDYQNIKNSYRPSHSDWTWEQKFGIKVESGGGRLSARETIGRVISGSVAEQILEAFGFPIKVTAWVDSVGKLQANVKVTPTREQIDSQSVRCPDIDAAKDFENLILKVKADGDSIGGTIRCQILGVPSGLGEPIFSKVEAELARAMMSLPASKSFEIGEGLMSTQMLGSEHNDAFEVRDGKIFPATNHHGGVQGGITTSLPILFRVGFKPVSTLGKPVESVNLAGEKIMIEPQGRHDPCVLPRAVPIVEAMAYMVILDLFLAHRARNNP